MHSINISRTTVQHMCNRKGIQILTICLISKGLLFFDTPCIILKRYLSIMHYHYFALFQQAGILSALVNNFRRIRKIILKVFEFLINCSLVWWIVDLQKYNFVFAKMYWTILRSLASQCIFDRKIGDFPSETEHSRPIKWRKSLIFIHFCFQTFVYLSLLANEALKQKYFFSRKTRPKK
jgi:hypothetical protein